MNEVASPSEVNALVDANGAPSVDGLRRINQAILARAYDAPDVVSQIAEAADDNVKAIGTTLTRIAPSIAQLRDMIADGRVDRQFDLSDPLTDLIRRVKQARDTQMPIGDILKQVVMFADDGVDPVTAALLRLFFRGQDLTGPRAVKKIVEALDEYIVTARQGADFFGELPSVEELIYAKRADVADLDTEGSFTPTGRAGEGAADRGGAVGRDGADGAGSDRDGAGRSSPDGVADHLKATVPADPAILRAFDDPDGSGAAETLKSLDHDARMALADPAAMPMVRLADDAEPVSLRDLMDELDADEAAIGAAGACQ
jgi:hypothetical protein